LEIRLENLKKTYSGLDAVNGVTLTIPSNRIYGIIGKSGAGKSTLVRMISMLERPDEGKVLYDGERVDDLEGDRLIQRRRRIGMIFQNFNLFSSRTASGNIAYPMEICKMDKAKIKERTTELLKLVGLEGRGDTPVSTLSGGQKQRIAIARALAVNPDILFCDEATSALDPQTTRSVLSLIREIQRKMNLTVVMITHQMEVVRDACDRVAVLDDGKVVEEGLVEDIFSNPKSEVTKDFLATVPMMRDSIVSWGEESGKYELRFVGGKTDEPIISSVSKKTGCSFNILAAGVHTLDSGKVGVMRCNIGPDDETAKNAIKELESLGVLVKEA